MKEQGGDEKRLLEIDIKKGAEFDMVEDPMYASLLRLSLDDTIEAVVCGPNCRTRSVLRHFPIPDQPDAQKPVRGWGGEEWVLRSNSDEERKKVEDDDLMLWRAITVSLISIHNRRAAQPEAPEPKFLIEQPSSPKNFPEVVAFWRTEEWRRLCEISGWKETHFNQGDWGGKSSKPTTVGGSMKIQVPAAKKSRGGEAVRSSKELERWSPGMMREVARWLVEDVQRREVRMMGISWDEHIQLGHVPFRRDCKICQESRQKQHPHPKVKHQLCGVLSLDTSGPHKDGQDLANQARYMMVGAFTWLVPKDMKNMKEEDVELPDDALQIEDWKDGRHLRKERRKKDDQKEDEKEGEVEEVVRGDRQAPEEDDKVDLGDLFGEDPSSPEGPEDPEDRVRSGRKRPSKEETKIRAAEAEEKEAEEKEVEEKEAPKEETEGKEVREGREVRVFRLVAPMASKRTEETFKTAIELVMRLRADGFWVNQIHTDQGHEYYGQFKTWCTKRGLILTRTAGEDPQGNGRAEVAVYAINRQVRATLLQTGADEVLRCARIGKEVPEFPAFLQKVTVRKRNWEKGNGTNM